MASDYAANLEEVQAAHIRIKPYINETPVLTSTFFDGAAKKSGFFKVG